jgi:two-component system, OmpR family, aerobic respiration control sensor histidine kinase ArcB
MSQKKMESDSLSKITKLETTISEQKDIILQLNNVAQCVPGSAYLKDKDGMYLWCNAFASEKMQSVNLSGSIVGKTDYDLFSKKVADDFRQNDLDVMKTKKEHLTEEITVLQDGQQVVQLSIKRPMFNESGDVIGVMGNTIDITDRKKAEALQKEKELAEKTAKFMEAISASIAHELRTPLAIVKLYTELLESEIASIEIDKNKKESIVENTDVIKDTITAASEMITNLLLKIRSLAHGKIDKTDFKPMQIVGTIENLLATYPFQGSEKGLVKFDSSNDFKYVGNEILTKHMLYNLLKNALRAIQGAGKGEIVIKLASDNKFNKLIFTDTSSGVPAAFLPKLFEQFETKEKLGKGSGLGLPFCKMVMNTYGGDITCDSKEGKYTTFTMSFPKLNG